MVTLKANPNISLSINPYLSNRKASAKKYPGKNRTKNALETHREKTEGYESLGMKYAENAVITNIITGIHILLIGVFRVIKPGFIGCSLWWTYYIVTVTLKVMYSVVVE